GIIVLVAADRTAWLGIVLDHVKRGDTLSSAVGLGQSRIDSDPLNPPKARSVKTRERIAQWVRDIGETDKGVQPNHAWRHTFKKIAERVGISEKVSDAITGHAPASVARSYGAPTVADMAAALEKFPRYDLLKKKDA
ncbi:MAG: hypothetical protein P8Y71_20075, partial [Pseudolabrys sp.]